MVSYDAAAKGVVQVSLTVEQQRALAIADAQLRLKQQPAAKGSEPLPQRGMGEQLATGVGAEEDGVVRLGETLDPMVDIWSQPDWAFLRGERLWSGSLTVAAAAGLLNRVGIANPTTNQLIRVDYMEASCTLSDNISLRNGVSTFVGTSLCEVRDSRWGPGVGLASRLISFDTNALQGGSELRKLPSPAGLMTRFEGPFLIAPGTMFYLVHVTANVGLTFNAAGAIRVMLPSEQARV